jgi:uncharacterized protein YecE (DUF72 family)
MNFYLGCAVWAYKAWLGDLFPINSHPQDFLRLYSQRLTTVEGNTTFYAIPDRATVQRWVAQTPDGFKFCPKLPKSVTHQGRLEPAIPAALDFLDLMQGLGDRLGPIFAQLPPTYTPHQWDDLTAFLTALSQTGTDLALEVRHPDWFQDPYASQLGDCLRSLRIGRVLLDSRPIYSTPDDPQIRSERRKPQLPLQISVTAPFTLVRLISHPQPEVNQGLFFQEWVSQVQQWLLQNIQVYFFVHCPVEARSPGNARDFQSMLEQQGVPVPPLPWNLLARNASTQLSLF